MIETPKEPTIDKEIDTGGLDAAYMKIM